MVKNVLMMVLWIMTAVSAVAQTPTEVLDKTLAALSGKGNITADYKITSSQGAQSGSIVFNGNKFRLLSPEMKCWYDGKTQWAYSSATGEVNITTPTASDLQMTNPYVAARNYKSAFNLPKTVTKKGSYYIITLTPKKKGGFKSLTLTIGTANYNIHKAKFTLSDDSALTIAISNYKTKVKMPNPFAFNKALVPKNTPVVDLR